jgi:hypothetical protein
MEISMSLYKYYLVDDGAGRPYEVYRGAPIYEMFSTSGVERAKKDGSWSSESSDIKLIMNLWRKGDFDPEDDEISEAQAMAYLEQWRAGEWPGKA